MHEPHASVSGDSAISETVSALLASLPPDFVFSAVGPAAGLYGLGRLNWRSGPRGGPVAVTGTDVAQIEGGRNRSLYVFLDPAGA
jgi:hypothetical protein